MSYKPDYGLYLMNEGHQDVNHYFYDFRLYSLAVIAYKQYSTMVELPFADEVYALSLDFNQQQLDQILTKAPTQIITCISLSLIHI